MPSVSFFFGSGFLECLNAIPGVRCGKDLDVMKSSGLKDKTPQVGQDAVMNAVLNFVDQ